tara:strand:+ start:689 stop:1369 length:681 start_codon:yes stop_codon:yes gene_type:complete
MADSLVLKGVKVLQNHTGSEMKLAYCKRGGDTHMLKRWWTPHAKNTVYVPCTVLDVSTSSGNVKLAVETRSDSSICIKHDGNSHFEFSGSNGISRMALFNYDFKLIESYEISPNPGGKVKVTPGIMSRPTEIGELTVSGAPETLEVNKNSGTIKILNSGTAKSLTYAWTKVSGPGTATFTASSSDSTKVKFSKEGLYSIKCLVASSDSGLVGGSPKTYTINAISVD